MILRKVKLRPTWLRPGLGYNQSGHHPFAGYYLRRLDLTRSGGTYVSAGILVLGVFLGWALWWLLLSGKAV